MSTLPALNNHRVRGWALWLVPALVLAVLVGWEIDWGRQIVRTPPAAPQIEPKSVAAAVLPDYQIEGGLAAHGETVERTLFNATRRRAPVLAGDGGPRQLTTGQFQLVGTTVAGDRKIAFLKESAGGKSRVVKQGDEINGMKVAQVLPDRVKFTLGDESDELFLKVAPGPKTTTVPPPPAPAAPPVAASPFPGAVAPTPGAAPAAGAPAAQRAAPRGTERQDRRQRRAGAAAPADGDVGSAQEQTPAISGSDASTRMGRGNDRTK